MKKILLILASTFLVHESYADCASAKQSATDSCSQQKIQESQAAVTAAEAALAGGTAQQGAAVTAQTAQAAATEAKAKLDAVLAACSKAQQSCDRVCKEEAAMWESTGMNPGPAQEARDNANYCKREEPEQNRQQGQQLSSNLGQTLMGLAMLLSQLGLGQGSESDASADCVSQPYQAHCQVDTAATPTASLASGTTRDVGSTGNPMIPALNANDVPGTGTPADPSYAQGTPGFGGGGAGLPMVPSSAASASGRGKNIAEDPEGGAPKINMPSGVAGGRGGGGGASGVGAPGSRTAGNPTAGRTSIDGDGKNISSAAAMEKAMQARGLAAEGAVGGISSAHSLDNFQKIEKRIQTERSQLSEL